MRLEGVEVQRVVDDGRDEGGVGAQHSLEVVLVRCHEVAAREERGRKWRRRRRRRRRRRG